MTRRSGLTSREEIILHLHGTKDAEDEIEGPYAATREGISKALEMRPNHVSREINALIRSGDVVWRLAHVLSFRKRVRIYRLSKNGLHVAGDIISSIKDVMVTVHDEFGNADAVTIDAAFKMMGGRRGYLDLFKTRGIESSAVTEPPSPIASKPEQFFGRRHELDALYAWFTSGRSRILMVYGIAGIGKTSLVSRFARSQPGRLKFYLKVREWDSPRGLLQAMGNALAGMGDERLQAHLRGQGHEDLTIISLILRDALGSLHPLIVLDDVWTASKDAWTAIMLLCDAIVGTGSKMIIISREFPPKLEGSLEAQGVVERLRLEGLEENDSKQLLEWRGLSESSSGSFNEIVRTLRGHPLLLKMIHTVEDIRPLSDGDVARFINGEIYSRLSREERTLLNTLALLRYPIPVAHLAKKMGFDVLESLHRKSLTERVGNSISLHDIMRSFVLVYLSENEKRACHLLAREMLSPADQYRIERAYHALSAGMAESAIEVLASESEELITSGHAPDLLALLEDLTDAPLAPKVIREILNIRIRCLAFTGQYASVIETFEKREEVVRSDPRTMLVAAECYLEIGNTEKAYRIYGRLKGSSLEDGLTVTMYRGLGRYHSLIGRYDEAKRYYRSAIEAARRAGLNDLMGRSLMDLGSIEIFREKWQDAKKCLLEAMRHVRKDDHSLARLYSNLSIIYLLRSMHDMALEMLERAEVTFKRSGDYIGMLKSMLNKGVILQMMGRNEEAEAILMSAVEMSRRAGVRHLLVGALTNLSNVYLVKGRFELSRDISDEALRIATELDDGRGSVAAKNNLALSHIRLGETKKGIRLLKEGLRLSERLGTHGLSADAMEGMYEGYMAIGRKAEAKSYADRALALAKEMGMARVVKRIERRVKKDQA